MLKYFAFYLIVLSSCKDSASKECFFQIKTLDGRSINIKGCLNKSIEYGHWVNLDSVGNVLEEGNYDNGILTGLWKYNLPDTNNLSIEWLKYKNDKFKITTNIPSTFTEVEEGDFYIKIQHSDTIKNLKLVIAIHDTLDLPFPIETYYQQNEKEISEKGWNLNRVSTTIESNGNIFYMNRFKISKEGKNRFLLNSYGPIGNGKILEINVNYDTSDDAIGRILFTSVSSNIFIDGKRYLYPYKSLN